MKPLPSTILALIIFIIAFSCKPDPIIEPPDVIDEPPDVTVDEPYGTLSDLRKLTEEAHKKNIAVIMDWVANHTSWDNAWIVNKDWYTQDGSGNLFRQ